MKEMGKIMYFKNLVPGEVLGCWSKLYSQKNLCPTLRLRKILLTEYRQ